MLEFKSKKMKNTFRIAFTLLLFLSVFIACQKEDVIDINKAPEKTQSEAINDVKEYPSNEAFYKANPNIVSKINFSEYAPLHPSIQIAIYDKMPNEKRLSFWKEKFKQDLKQEKLSVAVQTLMRTFINNIDLAVFESPEKMATLESQLESLEQAEQRYFLTFSKYIANEDNLPNQSFIARTCDKRWCPCSGFPPTPAGYFTCATDCSPTSSGCGWFGQQACDRYCKFVSS